jgi:hypothetical protein
VGLGAGVYDLWNILGGRVVVCHCCCSFVAQVCAFLGAAFTIHVRSAAAKERGAANYLARTVAEEGVLSSSVLGSLMQRSEGTFAPPDLDVVSLWGLVIFLLLPSNFFYVFFLGVCWGGMGGLLCDCLSCYPLRVAALGFFFVVSSYF